MNFNPGDRVDYWGPLCKSCGRDGIEHCDECGGCWVWLDGFLACPVCE